MNSYRLIKLAEVCDKASLGKSKLYAMMAEGRFPRPVRVGGAARWVEAEVDAALASFVAERDARRECEAAA